jgi:hypothetical protein
MQIRVFAMAVTALLTSSAPFVASAQQDWNGNEQQALGYPIPSADDASLDDNWKVYRFVRDGITYIQVNDLNDNVHAVIGKMDDVFWALPAGKPSARTSLPSWRLKISDDAVPHLVYADDEFSLVHYLDDVSSVWSVEPVH